MILGAQTAVCLGCCQIVSIAQLEQVTEQAGDGEENEKYESLTNRHGLGMGNQRGWQIQYTWYYGKGLEKITALDLLKKAAFNKKEAQQSVYGPAKRQ